MNFLNLAKRFHKDEDGAVTVDWVVLTAAVVGMGILVWTFIQPQVSALASGIGDQIEAAGTNMGAIGEGG